MRCCEALQGVIRCFEVLQSSVKYCEVLQSTGMMLRCGARKYEVLQCSVRCDLFQGVAKYCDGVARCCKII